MLRFMDWSLARYGGGIDVVRMEQGLQFDEGIWQKGRDCFRQGGYCDPATVLVVPVLDEQGRNIGCGWQDVEADRELRMLRELDETSDAVRFCDIFPDVREVVVYGCNELAYYFVKYLEHAGVTVSVSGRYWNCFHYQETGDIGDVAGKMIVLAEPIASRGTDLFQKVVRSASPGFECIDQIYEANILAGKIKDTEGGEDWFFEKLRGKHVAILGTDERAQDAYDLLYQHGIDIECFCMKNAQCGIQGTLLGKKINTVEEILRSGKDTVFMDVWGRKSALGTANVDFFDYYGYRRNERFFLLSDYMDIPYSNLVHVLNGRKLSLAGDKVLCGILAEYLERVENGNVVVRFLELPQWNPGDGNEWILCVVHPYYGRVDAETNPELWGFREQLEKIRKNNFYSEYFSRVGAFVLIDAYMNQNREKYAQEQLIPKGILLGAMPYMSGNILIRGLLDGHPDILKAAYDGIGNNLFWYCICLAWEKSQGISCSGKSSSFFPDWEKFKENIERVHLLEDKITSQAIFLAFHMISMESIRGEKIENMSQMVIYWEPHSFPREESPFLAKWLESTKFDGKTLVTRRNRVVWYGSYYKWSHNSVEGSLNCMTHMSGEEGIRYELSFDRWKEFTLRFEDIKLHPEEELLKLCDMIGIPWSDTLLHTTNDGWEMAWEDDVVDFDIKPVFNLYEEFFSEFDRFRICLVSSAYQKKYGYMYENCLKFSRRELQEMFLKKFRFQNLIQFHTDKDKAMYYLCAYALLWQQLWEVRKHMVLDDIVPEFAPVEIGRTYGETQKRKEKKIYEERVKKQEGLKRLIEIVKNHEKLVLYGIGQDCEGLWQYLEEADQEKILFCDRKALQGECIFHGKKVLAPCELCNRYYDYKILITSSKFGSRIQLELEDMGISQKRIERNMIRLWEA